MNKKELAWRVVASAAISVFTISCNSPENPYEEYNRQARITEAKKWHEVESDGILFGQVTIRKSND